MTQPYYPPPAGPLRPRPPAWWKRPVAVWLTIVIGLTAFLVGIGLGAGTKDKAVVVASSSSDTTTTRLATTAPTEPPPTTEATTTTAPQPVQVLDVSGSNKTTTDPFKVSKKWTITAELSGGAGVGVTVHRSSTDETVDYISFDAKTGGGSSTQRGDCDCYLEIEPFGTKYHVTVVDDPG